MLKETRQGQIIQYLERKGSVQVTDLCTMFQVTPMTIRRDLDDLEKEGKLLRTHGGALLPASDEYTETPFAVRCNLEVTKKRNIAQAAAHLVKQGQRIFLSSGSTVHIFSKYLQTVKHITIVTDAVNIAYELSSWPNVNIVMIGGELRGNTLSTTGNMTEKTLRQFKLDCAFIGVTAIDKSGKMYLNSVAEFGVIQVIFSMVDHVHILTDSTKLGGEDFVCIGSMIPGYTLVTDSGISEDCLENYKNLGIEVIIA